MKNQMLNLITKREDEPFIGYILIESPQTILQDGSHGFKTNGVKIKFVEEDKE